MDSTIINLLDGYHTIPFPREGIAVYAIGIQCPARFVPVYVGETTEFIRRGGERHEGSPADRRMTVSLLACIMARGAEGIKSIAR